MAFKQTWGFQRISLVFFTLVFFLGTFILTLKGDMFVSPDETANAFFAKRFSETGTFLYPETLNTFVSGLIHPRSVVVNGTNLVPGSFLGLPFYYGVIVFFLGNWILPFLTAGFFLMAVFAWHKLVRRWFSDQVAFVSSILLLVHPAFWYYSTRGLMHNVLFVCFLVFSVYFLFEQPIQKHLTRCSERIGKMKRFQKEIDWVLSGLFLGSSLFVRTSEVYWVIPLFIVLVCSLFNRIKLRGIFVLFFSFIVALLPMWILQWKTYGNPFVVAYTHSTSSSTSLLISEPDLLHRIYYILFPFGLHIRIAFEHIQSYGSSLFWWLTIPTVLGFFVVIAKEKKQPTRIHRVYIVVLVLLAVWLGVWYGSWVLYDNPDPTKITIANSYIRYWLPFFLLTTPLISSVFVWISEFAKTRFSRSVLLGLLILLTVWLNIRIVFFAGPDTLTSVSSVLNQSREIKSRVFSIVPENAVIIVERSDKIFFPGRRVLYPFRSENTFKSLPIFFEQNTPMFYYGITVLPDDFIYLNEQLFSRGFKLELIETFQAESLYRIISS